MFGEDTKIEIKNLFKRRDENILGTMSEDEGEADEEEEEYDDDDEEEDDEDYEDDGDYEDYEDGEELEEDDEEEEVEDEDISSKYGSMNINTIVTTPIRENLFSRLIRQPQDQQLFGNLSFQNSPKVFSQQNPVEIFIKNPHLSSFNFLTPEQINLFFKVSCFLSLLVK